MRTELQSYDYGLLLAGRLIAAYAKIDQRLYFIVSHLNVVLPMYFDVPPHLRIAAHKLSRRCDQIKELAKLMTKGDEVLVKRTIDLLADIGRLGGMRHLLAHGNWYVSCDEKGDLSLHIHEGRHRQEQVDKMHKLFEKMALKPGLASEWGRRIRKGPGVAFTFEKIENEKSAMETADFNLTRLFHDLVGRSREVLEPRRP